MSEPRETYSLADLRNWPDATSGLTPPIKLAHAAAIVGTGAYVIGFIASFWLPEPKRDSLPE